MALRREDSTRLSPEEYFALCENDLQHRYEYIDGYARMMAGGTSNHADIAGNCFLELSNALRAKKSLCVAKPDNMALAVTAQRYYLPDAMVTCDESDRTAGKGRLMHHPSLVVEVLSESTEMIDRTEKSIYYNNISSIQAYMIIQSDSVRVDIWQRGYDGTLTAHTVYYAGDTISFDFLDISITVDSLYVNTTGIASVNPA